MAIQFTQAEAECLLSAARQAVAPNYNARVKLDEAWLQKHAAHLDSAVAKLSSAAALTEAAAGEPKIVEVEVKRIVEIEKIVEKIVEVPVPAPSAEPAAPKSSSSKKKDQPPKADPPAAA